MTIKRYKNHYHARVEYNGVIGNAMKPTAEAAFMAAAYERYVTDIAFTRYAKAMRDGAELLHRIVI